MKQQGSSGTRTRGLGPGRHLERLDDPSHDPFEDRAKLSSPSVCTICGVVYENGRWRWVEGNAPAQAHKTRCPACARIAQGMPAGRLTLHAELSDSLREEIVRMMRNRETMEKHEHPMQRIMEIRNEAGRMEVTTTDVHLAQGLGHGLRDAYGGSLQEQFAEDEHMVRVEWTQEAH